jgi:Ras-related GTP-binding protein C/D
MSSVLSRHGDGVPVDPTTSPRQASIRNISPAVLNLQRVYEQNRQLLQKKDVASVPDLAAAQTKGTPRLLLMGQRRWVELSTALCLLLMINRSGKSSISSVVFHKLPPSETLFLESTARVQKDGLK